MSIQQTPHEKMLSTVLKKFPLVSKWHNIRSHHRTMTSFDCHILCTFGLMISAASGFCIQQMASYPTLFSELSETIFIISMGLCFGVVGVTCFYAACEGLWYNFSPRKQKKYLSSNKPAVLDCIAQKKAVRLVTTLIPEIPTNDLKLLLQHPNFNPVFKKHFEEEFKRREALEAVDKINSTFLPSEVVVEADEHTSEFTQVAVAKVNI